MENSLTMVDVFRELKEKKHIELKNGKYYLIFEGQKHPLATNIEKSCAKLEELGIDLAALLNQLPASQTPKPLPSNDARDSQERDSLPALTGADPKDLKEDYDRALEKVLGSIGDIKPEHVSADLLSVYFFHPAHGWVDSRKVGNLPGFKDYPHVRWMNKNRSSVDHGDGSKNRGYTVGLKSNFTSKIDGKEICLVKTEQDDTPTGPHWTIEKLVLCFCKRHQYKERQLRKVSKNKANQIKMVEASQEFLNAQSRAGAEKAIKNFEMNVRASVEKAASQAQTRESFAALEERIKNKSAEEQLREIEQYEKANAY